VHDETRSQSAKSKEPEANEVGALERALERFVLDLDLDWDAFHYLLLESLKEVDCNHEHALCRRILALMGLEDEAIRACFSYFTLQGGGCDCEVFLNVDMTVTCSRIFGPSIS
jgi:hypothetical protein